MLFVLRNTSSSVLFEEVGCAVCHPVPLYTDMQMRKSPYLGADGSWENRAFVTPTLVEIWRSAPLPDGYDTKLAESGESVSGGERQRIGIARAFLHDADMIFLDEPTSNIDSLNEGIILRSLDQEKANKTILLVSHRKSTMAIADDIVAM